MWERVQWVLTQAFGRIGARDAVARSLDRPPPAGEDGGARRSAGERIHHL